MAIDSLKFKTSDFAGQDVASLPDRPGDSGITAAQLKNRFDNIPKMMIALGKLNELIDALLAKTSGDSGADNIGAATIEGVSGATVQALLEAINTERMAHRNDIANPHGVTKSQVGLRAKWWETCHTPLRRHRYF